MAPPRWLLAAPPRRTPDSESESGSQLSDSAEAGAAGATVPGRLRVPASRPARPSLPWVTGSYPDSGPGPPTWRRDRVRGAARAVATDGHTPCGAGTCPLVGLAHRAHPGRDSHGHHLPKCHSAPHSTLASVYVLIFFHRKMKLALLSNASHWKGALPLRFSGNVRTFEALQVPEEFVHLVLHGN